ncbi:hypothetical protein [Sulfitobacter aestuariivivens]|nr:hypothetical protein [Sulfitobacter aestuariivivens]
MNMLQQTQSQNPQTTETVANPLFPLSPAAVRALLEREDAKAA